MTAICARESARTSFKVEGARSGLERIWTGVSSPSGSLRGVESDDLRRLCSVSVGGSREPAQECKLTRRSRQLTELGGTAYKSVEWCWYALRSIWAVLAR